MKLEKYEVVADESFMYYEFVSEGPKGKIVKAVQYSKFLADIYNLAFGDKDISLGRIDDTIITNNGDRQKVLATVVSTINTFIDKYPDVSIYARGSTKVRTRLYRIGITTNLIEISQQFEIYGYRNSVWEVFRKKVEYDAFLLRRKKITL